MREARAAPHRLMHEATVSLPAWLAAGDPQNPAVVMLHGAMMDMAMFEPLIAALQERFRVLAVDLPGHGRSAGLRFSKASCVDAVLKVLDREQIESCHLIGQSMGGIVCQLLIRQRPELAQSLTLIGSFPRSAPIYRFKAPVIWLVAALIRIAPAALSRRFAALSSGALPQTRAYIEACLRRLKRQDMADIFAQSGRMLSAGPYPASAIPALMIYGTRDMITLGLNRYHAKRWASRLGIRAHRIARASHNASMDRPDLVNALILEHLQSRTGSGP